MIVYHGSLQLFDRVDFNKVGMGGSLTGIGFYMTDNAKHAQNYNDSKGCQKGYLYEIDFKGRKSLSSSKRTFHSDALKGLLMELHNEMGLFWNICDVDAVGMDSALEQAVLWVDDDSDVEVVKGIVAIAQDRELVLGKLYEKMGYDCIVEELLDQTRYIALVSDAIDIVNVQCLNK